MLDALAELTKSLLIPFSFPFLLFGVTLGLLACAAPRTRRGGLRVLTLLVGAYWIASLPSVADLLATRFHAADAAPIAASRLQGAQAIVVLAAGKRTVTANGRDVAIADVQTVMNALEGARIHALSTPPLPIVASGGGGSVEEHRTSTGAPESVLMREVLVGAGVTADAIILESNSRTTRQQAQEVGRLLKERGWTRVVLVAPAVQLPRAIAVFRREGIEATGAAAPYQSGLTGARQSGWIPNGGALHSSERSTYDYLAWGYYWMRGWL